MTEINKKKTKTRIRLFSIGRYGWNSVLILDVSPFKSMLERDKGEQAASRQKELCHLLLSQDLLPFPGSWSPFFSVNSHDQILDRLQVNGHRRL